MSWTTGTLIDGWKSNLYVQDAGVTATVGTADEVPYGTTFSWSTTRTVTARGPHINKQALTNSVGGVAYTGSFTIDLHAAANTARGKIVDAVNAGTRLKFTLVIGGQVGSATTGVEKYVWDQCICSQDGTVDPATTATYTVNWTADSLVYTKYA